MTTSMKLDTTYLGMELEHPVVASASPLSRTVDGVRALEDGGAAAVVLFSLFEEQIRQEKALYHRLTEAGTQSFGEALSYFPEIPGYSVGPDSYLELVRKAVEAVDIPVVGSLNGVTPSGWTEYARKMEEAGASAIELNVFHIPADVTTPGSEVEALYLDILARVRSAVSVPVAVKLSPYFSATGHMALRLVEEGADGLVLFNRFYQPDFNLETLEVEPDLELSNASELRLPLLWIAILRGRVPASLAATTGVESGREVMKYLLAGADVVMTASALLRKGPGHCSVLREELEEWMARKGYESVEQMKGAMSQERVADPSAFERANYLRILEGFGS
jgi:dihydroorotate dehydrogenase (fumarate)